MSKASKAALLFAGLAMIGMVVTRLVLGVWIDHLWGFVVVMAIGIVIALLNDLRTIFEFFTMKTTKNGMNMGLLIVLALIGIVAVNYIAVRRDKKFDWTSEGLNSLADQSIKAIQAVKSDVEAVYLFRKGAPGEEEARRGSRDMIALYQNFNKNLKYNEHNALLSAGLAKDLEFTAGNSALYLRQGEKKVKVDGFTEENVTKALLKLTRENKKTIYFVTGHGERDLDRKEPDTISDFKQDLENSYIIKTIELFKEAKIPEDAAVVAVIGPKKPYLEPEFAVLRDYAKRGGVLFIAADPGDGNNLALLTKSFGIEYKNNYLIDVRAQVPGAGPVAALGTEFSKTSEMTRNMTGPYAVFLLASGLERAVGTSFAFDELVKAGKQVMGSSQLTEKLEFKPNGPHIIAMQSKGRYEGGAKDFQTVVFGDSDFMTNSMWMTGVNRDLVSNVFASLAKDTDLISIRPKEAKTTRLQMSREQGMVFLFGFLIPLPILMFAVGLVIWFRRRSA
jgi:ABC-type uncharacterized transport system involved in gliding motility auxiliary subunit